MPKIVMRIAVQRLRVDLDVVEAGDGHALEKILDVPVAALPRVGVRLLVKAEILVVEGSLVRSRQLLVLQEVAVEIP
jgi:hypothetical protein